MKKEIISTKKAPSAIGPYSQGMIVGDYIFTSGQIPLNPENGQLVTEISKATVQVMENISAVLEAAGSSLEKVIKTKRLERALEKNISEEIYNELRGVIIGEDN